MPTYPPAVAIVTEVPPKPAPSVVEQRRPRLPSAALNALPVVAVLSWAFSLVCGWLLRPGAAAAGPAGDDGLGNTLWLTGWLAFPLVAVVLLRRPEGRRLGVLFAGVGFANLFASALQWIAVLVLVEHHAVGAPAHVGQWLTWISNELFVVAFVVAAGKLLLRFPTGLVPSRRWRPPDRAATGLLVAALLAEGLRPGQITNDIPAVNPVGIPALEPVAGVVTNGVYVALAALALVGLVSVVRRWRRSAGLERRQLAALALAAVYMAGAGVIGVATVLAGLRLPPILGDLVDTTVTAAVPIATGVALLRHGLFDVEVALRRSATYLGVSAVVVAAYSGSVVLLGQVFEQRSAFGASLVATGLVAVAFGPLKEAVQGGVDRLLYGNRHSPYRALARLGEKLEGTADPAQLLAGVVESVADALRLPYVALLVGLDATVPRVQFGSPRPASLDLPLVFGGSPVGRLLLASRAPGERFGEADRRLLSDLGRHIAGAVHALALTDHLQVSRERLVLAREEERRRLRRDLHDGLGPSLAAVTLQLDTLRRELSNAPPPALAEAKAEIVSCVGEVRRLVQGLRPPALDELGLAGAVRHQARLLSGPGCEVDVIVDELPELPAAVEVACFRIVSEALTNVARHACATACSVRFEHGGGRFVVEVIDDGLGTATAVPITRAGAGLGLRSMRERAEEVGGTLTIDAPPTGGTRIRAELPAVRR
jgi:signal transduction histidine kinase